MKKALAAFGVSVGVFGGGIAGFLVTSNASSVGATASVTSDAPTTTTGSTGTANSDPKADHAAWIDNALAPLVKSGTITQDQADKVKAALEAAGPMGGRGKGGGPGFGKGFGGAELDAVAKALNMTSADLTTALKAGTTIADLATKQGVTLQSVVDAAVAPLKTKVDQAVKDGKMTQTQADDLLKNLTSKLTDFANGKTPFAGGFGMGFPGGPMGGGMGRHHGGQDGAPNSSAPSTTTA